MIKSFRRMSLALSGACLLFTASVAPSVGAEEEVKFECSQVPKIECGPSGNGVLKGKIVGPKSFKGLSLLIYSHCDGIFYIQPTAADPITEIEDDGSFDANVHGAQYFVLLLVKQGYKVEDKPTVLPKAGGNVIAVSSKIRPK